MSSVRLVYKYLKMLKESFKFYYLEEMKKVQEKKMGYDSLSTTGISTKAEEELLDIFFTDSSSQVRP